MTSFKKYFIYHFKNTFWRLAIIAVLCILPVATSVWINNIYQSYSYIDLSILSYIAAVISTIIPILELLPFKNRRNMDTILFLPIDRRKLASVHFINGFIHVFLINVVTFISAYFVLEMHSYPFKIWNLFLVFSFTVLGSLAVYSLTAFIFDCANTALDGIIWLVIYSFIGCNMLSGIEHLIEYAVTDFAEFNFFKSDSFTPYFILLFAWDGIHRLLFPYLRVREVGDSIQILEEFEARNIYKYEVRSIILWSILIILCIFGFIWFSKNKRTENIGSISNSPFGYKVILPLLAASVLCYYNLGNLSAMLILLVIGYIIYRRSLRFKLIDYISIAASLILPAILVFIAKSL